MTLTRDEARRLHELSAEVRLTDPSLARALASGRLPSHRAHVLCVLALAAVLVALVVGVALQIPPLCAAAWTGVIALMMCAGIAGD